LPDWLLYSFGAVGECLFQLDIAASPADRLYFDIIFNGGGLDGIARARPEPYPCRPADRGCAGGAGYRGGADVGFRTIGRRCVSAMAIIAGAYCAGLALAHTNLRKAVLDAIQPVQSLLLVVFFVSIGLLVDLEYVKSHWGVIVGVTFGVLLIKTLLGWALLTIGGEPAGRALVSSLVTPQIGEFSFVLTTSGVASGIFSNFEADFLLAVIAASLFLSPLWSGMLHYLVIRYRIHDPVALPSNPAEPE